MNVQMDLRIGFVCIEYFHFDEVNGNLKPSKAHGGFGFVTRMKAEYLAKMGYDVHVFIPASNFGENKNYSLEINKVNVHAYMTKEYKSNFIGRALRELRGLRENEYLDSYLREIRPDILQSEDTPPADILIKRNINIPFVLVFQDPFDSYDVNLLLDAEYNYLQIPNSGVLGYQLKPENYHFKNKFLVNMAMKRNSIRPIGNFIKNSKNIKVFSVAKFISEKTKKMFNLPNAPDILLNPIDVLGLRREKYDEPTIVWVARWDPQKRPDMALLIAKQLPQFKFIMIGTANRTSAHYEVVEEYLKEQFSDLKNLKILGFISEDKKREIIGRSWALLNTSIREGLPSTFEEALAEGTPLVSYVDPDQYVSKFGIKAKSYTVEGFVEAIKNIIEDERFRNIGSTSIPFIKENHEATVVMNRHLKIYKEMLSNGEPNTGLYAEMKE